MLLRANAKLLLTGEYLVLKGARAIAMPLHFGQELTLYKGIPNKIVWESIDPKGCWFSAIFDALGDEMHSSISSTAKFVSTLLKSAEVLHPGFLSMLLGQKVVINADFDLQWGLGSSSSLISLVAQLAAVEGYLLHKMVSSGSGYDVIAAQQSTPFIFQLVDGMPKYSPVALPLFLSKHLFFAYLGKKQGTASCVKAFLDSSSLLLKEDINHISELSLQLLAAINVKEVCRLLEQHETVISKILGVDSIKKASFRDFNGCVKSLGAWGGDFALFCSEEPELYIRSYLDRKGLSPVFRFDEIGMSYGK